MSLYSSCCSAPTVKNSEDYGICVKCGEPTEFYDDDIPEEYSDGTDDWIERVTKQEDKP